jgi:hypothetical protein
MILRRTSWEFIVPLALKEVRQILAKHKTNNGQLSLTHSPEATTEEQKLYGATGSLYDYDTGKFIANESDFTVFNSEFEGTYLHEIYRTIGCVGRMRIMSMQGPTAYTIHRDVTTRYHLALQTNEQCMFIFPTQKQQIYIPADGNVYEVDTKEYHTFLNGSRSTRIHLVMDNLNSYE